MEKLRLTFLSVILSLTLLGSAAQEPADTARVVNTNSMTVAMSHPLTLKTNVVGWGMLMVNVAAEYEFYPRWSVEVPVYYSCWNYFGSDIKFRNLIIQPEIKYYVDSARRFSVGAHIGVDYYNWSFDGRHRYQTHDKSCPLGGGGLSFSYRTTIDHSQRWGVEVSLGVGAYLNEYDRYKNDPCDCDPNDLSHYDADGNCPCRTPDFIRTAFVGIDKLCVSFTYTFDIRKR